MRALGAWAGCDTHLMLQCEDLTFFFPIISGFCNRFSIVVGRGPVHIIPCWGLRMLGGVWGSLKLHPSHHKTSGGETWPQGRGQIPTRRLGTFLGSTTRLSTTGGHSCPRGWAGRAVVEQKILAGANFSCALSFGGTATFEGGEVDDILPISQFLPYFFSSQLAQSGKGPC